MFRRTATAVALLAVGVAVPAHAATLVPSSQQHASQPATYKQLKSDWPRIISGHTPDRYPEGVAWDPTRQAFLVGSMGQGTVSVVDRTGAVRRLVSDPQMVSTFGLHVDAARGRFLVTYADIGAGERSSPATAYVQSGVGIYDLRTGRLQHRVDLNTKALNPQGGKHGANDLAIDRQGNAYVTDPASDAIYRITPSGKASVLIRDARFQSDSIGLNGVVWDPAGYLLAVRYDTGKLLRISLHGTPRIDEVKAKLLVGGDGVALTRDGKLVAVTNKLGANGVEEVTVLRSADGYRSASVVSSQAWPVAGPTTVALTPYGGYVLSGRIDVELAGGTSDEFDLRRI